MTTIQYRLWFQNVLAVVLCWSFWGCLTGEVDNEDGALSWSFDYTPYTTESPQQDIRNCSNEPGAGENSFDTPDISSVRVLLRDPSLQSPDFDQNFDCADGSNGEVVALRGLAAIPYELTLEAYDADNRKLYEFVAEEEVDFANYVDEEITLRTITGETQLNVSYPGGSLDCEPSVENFVISAFLEVDGNISETPASSITVEACEGVSGSSFAGVPLNIGFPAIPVDPIETESGSYVVDRYEIKTEAVDADGEVLFCGRSTTVQGVLPGSARLNSNVALFDYVVELEVGVCP